MKYIQILFWVCSISVVVVAQKEIKVEKNTMSQGNHECVTFMEPRMDDRTGEKLWKDYIKKYKARAGSVRRSDELLAEGARIPKIGGSKDVDVYFLAQEYGKDVKFKIWYSIDSNFVEFSKNQGLQKGAEEMVMEFYNEIEQYKIGEKLDEQEDLLKDFEKDLKKLERLNDRYHKKIEKAKEEIAENENNILQNEQEQEAMRERIEQQAERVQEVKEELKAAKRN